MDKKAYEKRLKSILRIHFDPNGGTPYWLEKAKELGISPTEDIHALEDLILFGPMDETAMKNRPIEDFVPRSYWAKKSKWVIAETGGTMGHPIMTVYDEEEFRQAFIDPFVTVARYRNFPKKMNWLWIGPNGPHIIGTAAIACARALNSPNPFTVDFDPRWDKKLSPASIGFRRYFNHILEQSLRIIETQKVGIIFSTPKVLFELKKRMSAKDREAILGIHFGGTELNRELFQSIAEDFPNAIFISGYGNTLFGMCPEFKGDPHSPLDYFPLGPRLIFFAVPLDPDMTQEEKLKNPCAPGECGQIVFSRLDQSFLILNFFERDQGELISPPDSFREWGMGIRNPHPLSPRRGGINVNEALY